MSQNKKSSCVGYQSVAVNNFIKGLSFFLFSLHFYFLTGHHRVCKVAVTDTGIRLLLKVRVKGRVAPGGG